MSGSKLIVSKGGLAFINEEISFQEKMKESEKKQEELRKFKEKRDAEELRIRLAKEEADRRHKEARSKLMSTKRSAISIQQEISNINGSQSPFQRGRFSISPTINDFMEAINARAGNKSSEAKIVALAIGLTIGDRSKDRSNSPYRNKSTGNISIQKIQDDMTAMTNEEVLKTTVKYVVDTEQGYINKKAAKMNEIIKQNDSQKLIHKKLNDLCSRDLSSKSLIKQNMLLNKVQVSKLSEGFVKEIKEVQRLKKLGYRHNIMNDVFKRQAKHNENVCHIDNHQKSIAGKLFEDMNQISTCFHDVVEVGIKRGGAGKLPAINASHGIKGMCENRDPRSYMPTRHHRHRKESSISSTIIGHVFTRHNRANIKSMDNIELSHAHTHRHKRLEDMMHQSGAISDRTNSLHRKSKSSLIFLHVGI